MSETGPATAAPSPAHVSSWADDPDYPHRIENHVKVYLHLEESPTRPVGAALDTGAVQEGTSGGTSRWVVSDVSVDGYPLDGVEDGHYCDYEGHPPGARLDWDRQHREAANVHLPTAVELLPLLATALGRRVGPTVDKLRAASDLLTEYSEWRAERAEISAGESAGAFPVNSDWHDSDDVGRDLADRAIALLAEVTGHASPASGPTCATPSEVSLMRSTLNAAPDPSSQPPRPESVAPSQPPIGPAR